MYRASFSPFIHIY